MIGKYLKQTGKHSLIYGIGNLVSKIIAFILIPIYTRVLSTEEYGILSLMTITLTITGTLLSLSLHTSLFRFFVYDYENEKDRKNLISTITIFLFPFLIIVIGLLVYFSDLIATSVFGNIDYGYYLKLIFLAAFFEIVAMITLAILRAKAKSKVFSIFVVARFILQIGFIIYYVVYLQQGIGGALKGMLYAFMTIFVLNMFIIVRNIDFTFSTKKLNEILRFSIPLIPAALAVWVMGMISRFFLDRMIGPSSVGIYTLGFNMGLAINFLFVSPIQLAWAQIKWTILKDENEAPRAFSYIVTYYVLIGTFLFLGLSMVAKELIVIVSTEPFYEAANIVSIIALSYLMFGIYFMINFGIVYKKKTEVIALLLLISAALNILLNYILIPRYTIMGAAVATLISYILLVILTYFFSNKYYKIEYQWKRIIKIVLVAAFLLFIDYLIPDINVYLALVYKTLLSILFFGILYLLGLFEEKEIRKVKEFTVGIIKKIKKD